MSDYYVCMDDVAYALRQNLANGSALCRLTFASNQLRYRESTGGRRVVYYPYDYARDRLAVVYPGFADSTDAQNRLKARALLNVGATYHDY